MLKALCEQLAVRDFFTFPRLVVTNILLSAILVPLNVVAEYYQFFRPPFNPFLLAAAAMISTQLLLLAIFTAFYDPRRPPTRWLSIAAILLGSGLLLGLEMVGTTYVIESVTYGGEFATIDRLLIRMSMALAATSAVLAGCMGVILVLHIAAWPLRALLGLRLVNEPHTEIVSHARQFGITHLMAWVGLFAALLWLLRIVTDSEGPVVMFVVIAGLILVSSIFVMPWVYLLVKVKIKRWPIFIGLLGVAVLSYLAQEATGQFNAYQVMNTKSVAAAFLLPAIQFQDFAAFTGTISLVTLLNCLALRQMGMRFRRLKSEAVPSHSTAIAPQPS